MVRGPLGSTLTYTLFPYTTLFRSPGRQGGRWGAGPRAGQALVLAAKARALLHGRLAATREDVKALAAPVMRHRLLLSFVAEAERRSADDVIAALLDAVPYPDGRSEEHTSELQSLMRIS